MAPSAETKTRTATRPIAARLQQLLRAHEFDRTAWERIIAADVHVRIGNAPPSIGKDAALGDLGRFLRRIESVGAGFCAVWQRREAVFAETEIHFTDAACRPRSIPCTIVARVTQGSVCDLRIHLDPTPIP